MAGYPCINVLQADAKQNLMDENGERSLWNKLKVYITKDCSSVPALVVNILILAYAHCGSR